MLFRSIPEQFMSWGQLRPTADAYAQKCDGEWVTTDWKTYTDEVRRAAAALIASGLERGDRVGLMGINQPEWTITDLAAMTAGGIPVGIYTTCAPEQIRYILHHAGARIVLVNGTQAWEYLSGILDELPAVRQVILCDDGPEVNHPLVVGWDDFINRGVSVSPTVVEERLTELTEGTLGAIIYTSGTTGHPRGAKLTHGNMAAACEMGKAIVPTGGEGLRHLSYLPLAHAAERALSLMGPASNGYAVFYSSGPDNLRQDLLEVRPHMFLGVPRVWEKIYEGLTARFVDLPAHTRRLLQRARTVALRVHEIQNAGASPGPVLGIQYRILRRLVLDRIKRSLGLDLASVFLTGAAPIDTEVLRFMASIDIPIREIYGQTEDCGPTTVNLPGARKWDSVGRPFDGVKVKIADDGEILVAGPHVFSGYYRDEETTRTVLKDGWLYSGDMGRLDEDGYLYLTGRKKEILITAGGKNISPVGLESLLKRDPLIADAVVIGDRRKYLVVLLTLRTGELKRFADERGMSLDGIQGHPDLTYRIQGIIDRMNESVSRAESIKKFLILPGAFTVGGGELTPTFKLRRSVICARYVTEIESMYTTTTKGEFQ